ncbi:MAG: hypothetical protein Q8N23_36025 [Archangium sp.]|nr:hypothetical protein [Archangium sp.]MDP3158136.1 hypothetical protein [Archangium sp.]MDP3570457.1 hypothetical protein [Archangium sp.]
MRLFLLTVLAFAVRLQLLLSNDEPTGWDGYSYVVQVERLVSEGRLHWPDASWVTYFLGALHLIIPSSIIAVKVGACLLAALVVPAAWRLGNLLAPPHGAWLLACWAAASPTLTHLAGDFIKNLGVVAPLLLVFASRERLLALVGGVLAAALAHRLGAALLIAAAVGTLSGAVFSKLSDRRLLLVALGLGVFFTALSVSLPNLLHPADLDRLQTQFTFSPGLPPPLPYFALRDTRWPQRVELLLAWPALAFGAWQFFRVKERRPMLGALLLPLVVCLFPFWRSDSLDVGYRLVLMAPVFAFPVLLLASPPRRKSGEWVAVVLIILLARSGFDPHSTPPYAAWRELIRRIPRPLPALLIAPQGFNFLYDHHTGQESLAWSPEPGIDRTTTSRLVWDLTDGEWAEFAQGLTPQPVRLDAQVVYVREDVWEQVLTRARREDDDALQARLTGWRNPSKVRPRSLQRNH